jgi:hypothetical protein
LFWRVLTVVSISEAAASLVRVTIAAEDLLSVGDWPGGRKIFTLSTLRMEGINALITEGDVPGGSDARCNVGFEAALSASSAALSASAAPNADAGTDGP